MRYILNDNGSVSVKKDDEEKKQTVRVESPKQSAFQNAIQNVGNTIDNSAVRNFGFSLPNLITDAANLYDANKELQESIPLIGEQYKLRNQALKTAGNVATNMGTGATKTLESTLDTLNDISDKINNPIAYLGRKAVYGKDVAEKARARDEAAQEEFIKRNLTQEFKDKTGYSDVKDDWEKGSLVNEENFGGQVAQGVGGMVPALLAGQYLGATPEMTKLTGLTGKEKALAALGNVGKTMIGQLPSSAVLGASSYGGGLEQALNEGATREQARKYGLANAAIEAGTEMMTGGIPGLGGKGGLDALFDPLINANTNGMMNLLLKAAYGAFGEGLEEYASAMLEPLAKKIYSNEPIDWKQVQKDARNAFLVGATTGAILNGPQTLQDYRNVRSENRIRNEVGDAAYAEGDQQYNPEYKGWERQRNENRINEAIRKDAEAFNLGRNNAQQEVQSVQKEEVAPTVSEVQENKKRNVGVHYGDLGKARDTYYWDINSSNRSTGHFGTGTYFLSEAESNKMQESPFFSRKDRTKNEIDFDDYNLYKPKIESEAKRLHDGLKAINYGKYDDYDFKFMQDDLKRNGVTQEQIDKALAAVEKAKQDYKERGLDDDYKAKADSLSTIFMKNLGYEGIDVRGLEGLDNTGYGSVIYDLKPQTETQKETNGLNEKDYNENVAETKSEPVIKAAENSAGEGKQPAFTEQLTGDDVDEDAFFKERMKQLEEQQESKTEAEPYTDNGEVAEILTETPKEPKKPLLERLNETRKKFTRDFISKGAEIEDLSRKYKNPNLNWAYDRLGIARAEAQQHIGSSQRNLDLKPYYNFIDSDGKMTSMSLNDIREDARTHNIPEAELNEYLAHYLNVDRYSQGKPVFGMNVDEDVSKQKIRQLEIQHPDIKRIAKNVWTFEQNQLQNMVDSGLISEQFAKELKEKNPHYVRIQRDVKGYSKNNRTINGENSVKVNQQIQTAKGGNQNILPIMEGIAKYTEQVHQSERMNLFGQELEKTLGMGSQDNSINSITDDESFGINPDIIKDNGDGTYSMTIFKDGTATVIPINKGIYESLTPNKMVQAVENDETFKKLSYPPKQVSKMFRTLTTDKNPVFMFTNAFRDIGDAPFNSKYTKEFTKAYVSGEAVKQVFTRGGYDQLLEAAGGRQNSYFADGEFTDKSQTKLDKARDKILYPIERGNEIVEATPRMAEFIATIKANGYDVNSEGEMYVANENKATRPANEVLNEALYNSAEVTTNFKRGGDVTKMLNRNGATFLNASVQGFDKQVRNFTQLDNPKQVVNLLTKALIFGIAPTILNDGMYDDDKEYEELEDYQKDNYYLFKTKNGIWVRIPKGRAMGVIGSLLRRTKNYAKGDKKAYEGFLDYASNQVAPNSVIKNNIFAPFFQVKNNKSWSGNKIISDSMIKRPTEEQYNEKTDEISKFIGKQIKDLPLPKELKNFKSPLAIHYLLDQYSGAIGDVILPMFTEKSSSKYNPLIAPFISKFTADAVYSNKSVSEYYDKKEELDEKRYSENSTPLDVAKSSYMTSQAYEMSDLYKKQREIQNNKSLSKAQKYDQAREVQKEINKKAKQIVKNVDNAEEHEYYVKIGDYYYKKVYKDGQIKYVRDTSTKIPTESYALYDYYKKKYEKSKEEAKG